jgi:hypothetical protein
MLLWLGREGMVLVRIFHAPSIFFKPIVRRSRAVLSFASEAFVPHLSNAVANATVSLAVTSRRTISNVTLSLSSHLKNGGQESR